jgi:chaperonin cofactor prefoldin
MLAFLLCLCLAVVGVVGDLTDADFAKIGSLLTNELDKRDERLYTELGTLKSTIDALETKFDTLETKFDTLETKFDTLETKFDTLNTTLSIKIDVLDTKIDYIKFELSKNHFFNRIRIDVLQNVSGDFAHCINPDGSTKHSGT